MKTKILLIGLLLSFTAYTFAQVSGENYQSDKPGKNTNFKKNKGGDNWFFHIGGGGQMYLGDFDDEADLTDRITSMATLSLGKWFNPYWGVRLKGQGGAIHSFERDAAFMQHDKYYNVHLDAMWNLVNYFGTYSSKKVFNFGPYVGLGFAHRFENDQAVSAEISRQLPSDWARHSNAISVNGGLMFGFRLSERVNLDFDLGLTVVPDYFERIRNRIENDGIVTASGGFTFKIGKTDFQAVEPMDYALINDLNSRINSLRSENDELRKRPISCPECPEITPTTTDINYVPNVVFFRLNSSKIDANQQISIYNTAQFIKETGEKIKVVGYADKNTGTSSYNMKLSERRAKAVAKELTNKYNIPTDKIIVEWKGSDEQPYPQNNWNRVVIMSAQ